MGSMAILMKILKIVFIDRLSASNHGMHADGGIPPSCFFTDAHLRR